MNVKIFVRSFAFVFALTAATAFAHRADTPNWPAYGPCTPDNRYTVEGAIPVVNQLYREQLATLSDARFPLPRQFDLVTIGDSITDNWDTRDKDNYFALAGANGAVFNLGIGGDRIEQLIWRLEEGGCNNFKAKFITLLIGTNNSYQRRMEQGVSPDDPVEMAKGIERVLWNLKTGHPEAKILLMPILPYEKLHTEGAPECRANNENVNDLIIKFVDNRQVFWLDIRGGFLNADGTFRDEYWSASGESGSDGKGHYLHPSGAGYREVFDPAVRAAMAKIDATLSAGTAQETDPSLGYASASVDSWNSQVTMTLSGVYVGTDSSAVRASSYKVEYKLDDGSWTMALENQTLTRNSFVIEEVAVGQHTCEIRVTTSAGKTVTTVSKFFMGDAWIAKPLGATSASVRTDGNLVCAYANARCTVAGVAFAAAGGSVDDANIKWPFGATGGSQAPTGVESGGYSDLLTHCWWMNPGTGGGQSTVTLKGLTAGHEYLVQLFAYRSAYNDGFLYVVGTQSDTTFIRAGGDGWPYGGTLVGRFMAAAETKDIVIQIEGATALNGIQVRDLGEGGYIPPTPPVDPPVEPPVEPPDDPVDPPAEPVESGWTAEPMDSVGAKFSTQGELKYAYATQGVTVNGVSFTRQITLADSDSIAFSPADYAFGGAFMNEGASGGFGLLLGNGWYWKEDGVTARTVTLTLKNLTSGKKYLVQILSHTMWNNNLVVSAGGCAPRHVHGSDEAGGKYGALLTGVFTASATTQAVSISFANGDGEHPINAIQVRELGEGGDDPVAPPVVRTLTIPEKTGLTLVSVTTNGVAVSGSGNAYAFFDNAQVAVSFAAASGYEIVSGNPVVITMTADRTLADGEYPVVRTTSGGDDPIEPSVAEGWTGARLGADSGSVRTDGTLVYAYAKAAYQAGEVQFTAFGNVEWTTFENDDLKFYLNGNAPSASAPSGTESGGYADLLTHGWWYNGGSQAMTLKRLKAGTQYLVQVFCYRSSYNGGHVTVDGETLQGESYVTSGAGDFTYGGTIIGVFTADSTTKSITFKSTSQWCFNAVQVRELPVELPEPEAPVIGGEGVNVPFAVSSDRVSITIGNAASGVTYGYRKSTTLAGLKTAEPVWLAPAEVTDGVLVIEITKDPAEPNCFYQICVK